MKDFIAHNPDLIHLVILPLLICCARIMDVTLGTLRIVYISKGMRNFAAIAGFFEVTIWVFAVGQIVQHLDSIVTVFAYATGYTIGNYVGIMVEEKVCLGNILLRAFVRKDAEILVERLSRAGCGVTRVLGQGAFGTVDILFTVIRRKEYRKVIKLIQDFNPETSYTVEDIKDVKGPSIRLSEQERIRICSNPMLQPQGAGTRL
jgi:uncharacterized protein YebE (UPF0316 family)